MSVFAKIVIILLKTKLHRFVNHIEKYIKLKIILTIRIEQQTRVVREKNMAKIINLWIFAKSKISHCRHVLYSFLYCSEITSNILILQSAVTRDVSMFNSHMMVVSLPKTNNVLSYSRDIRV